MDGQERVEANFQDNFFDANTEKVVDVFQRVFHVNRDTVDVDYDGLINRFFQFVDVNQIMNGIQKGKEYVVQIPSQLKEGFDAGKYFIMENSETGKTWPTLMEKLENGKNQIVTPLPVKAQEYLLGNPMRDYFTSFQNARIQQQLHEISELLEQTLEVVNRIEHGQLDDRIGMLKAGKQQIFLALNQKDESSRTHALLHGMQDVSRAQGQIAETLKRRVTEFKALPKTAFIRFGKELMKAGYLSSRDDEYQEIQEYFDLYLQATKLLAGAYIVSGDTANAERVFQLSLDTLNGIDFRRLESIKLIHPNETELICDLATEYLVTEKQNLLEEAKQPDCMMIEVSGEKLLEVIGYGNAEKVSE